MDWLLRVKALTEKNVTISAYTDKDGYSVTIEGLSRLFDKEFWNYAKLISGVLRHGMPIPQVVDLIGNLSLYDESINTWKAGVERALKKYIPNGTKGKDRRCPNAEMKVVSFMKKVA